MAKFIIVLDFVQKAHVVNPRGSVEAMLGVIQRLAGRVEGVCLGGDGMMLIIETPDNLSEVAISTHLMALDTVEAVKTAPLIAIEEALNVEPSEWVDLPKTPLKGEGRERKEVAERVRKAFGSRPDLPPGEEYVRQIRSLWAGLLEKRDDA